LELLGSGVGTRISTVRPHSNLDDVKETTMDRRKKLATAGAISVTATAAVIALGSTIGLFGLTDDTPRVGKLSPIDSTHSTTSSTTPNSIPPTTVATVPSVRHDGADDGVNHDLNDDPSTPSTTITTLPHVDDHGGGDNSGPGSTSSGDGGGDDDNSGPGSSSSGRDHPEDD
jgi:hypothetical protein